MPRRSPTPPGGVVVITGASSGMGEDAALYLNELVADALARHQPAPRQIVGGGARMIHALGCLPDRVQDAVIARMLARIERRGRRGG